MRHGDGWTSQGPTGVAFCAEERKELLQLLLHPYPDGAVQEAEFTERLGFQDEIGLHCTFFQRTPRDGRKL